MIITRTPLRVSLLGGGTDYPAWAREHGGLVVGGAVNKFCYITARYLPPFHSYKHRVVYSEIETTDEVRDIKHNAVRSCIQEMGWSETCGLEVSHISDLPGRSGTGSSSSFVVGLLNALGCLQGKRLLPHELTQKAIQIEQGWMQETVGCQDQTFAAYGGVNTIRFKKDGEITVFPLPLSATHVQELESHLLLFFTGVSRTSSEVAKGYANSLADRKKEQFALLKMAEEGADAICRKKWERLGQLIDMNWRTKSRLPGVSNEQIAHWYATARLYGAFGGKITGAGGGGCMLLVAPPEKRAVITAEMKKVGMVHIPFRFDFDGSVVVFSDKENLQYGS